MSGLRGRAAVVGAGESAFHKRGTSPDPELKLLLQAIVAAADDAGIDPADIDGFVSFGSERNSGQVLMRALGTKEMRLMALQWAHGGGIPGALGLAASAVALGQADAVVVYRALAQEGSGRLRVAVSQNDSAAQLLVNGIDGPLQLCALRTQRMIEADGVPASTLRELALVDYHHAQANPAAMAHGRPLTAEDYARSRMIVEPYRLFDCSRESDAASAVIVVSAERARTLRADPAYILSVPSGVDQQWGGASEENRDPYGGAGFTSVARRLWAESGYGPGDVDVAQVYENTTGLGVAALIDHGFCTAAQAGEFVRFDNLVAPGGALAVNTSGGNLAEAFNHGMSLVNEAVRQLWGRSVNQVPGAALSLMTGGPGDTTVSSALFGTADTL